MSGSIRALLWGFGIKPVNKTVASIRIIWKTVFVHHYYSTGLKEKIPGNARFSLLKRDRAYVTADRSEQIRHAARADRTCCSVCPGYSIFPIFSICFSLAMDTSYAVRSSASPSSLYLRYWRLWRRPSAQTLSPISREAA